MAYASISQTVTKGRQSWKFQAGIDAEGCLLACTSWFAQPIFYRIRDYLPRGGIVPGKLCSPTSIKKMPHRLAYRSMGYGYFLSQDSLFPEMSRHLST